MKKILTAVLLFFMSGPSLFAQTQWNQSSWICDDNWENCRIQVCTKGDHMTICRYILKNSWEIFVTDNTDNNNDNSSLPPLSYQVEPNTDNPAIFSVGEDLLIENYSYPILRIKTKPFPKGISFNYSINTLIVDTDLAKPGKYRLKYEMCYTKQSPGLNDITWQHHGTTSSASSEEIVPIAI